MIDDLEGGELEEIKRGSGHLIKALKCPICLESYRSPIMMLASCSHLFCKGCLDQCLATKESCPMCNTPSRRREVREAPNDVIKVLDSFRAIVGKIHPQWNHDVELEDLKDIMIKQTNVMNEQKKRKFNGKDISMREEVVKTEKMENEEANNSYDEHSHYEQSPQIIEPRERTNIDKLSTEKEVVGVKEKQVSQSPAFSVGSVVRVADRCWIAMNKPGGAAFVTDTSSQNGADGIMHLYDVRFILDGRQERDIPDIFVSEMHELSRSTRSRRTTASWGQESKIKPGKRSPKIKSGSSNKLSQSAEQESVSHGNPTLNSEENTLPPVDSMIQKRSTIVTHGKQSLMRTSNVTQTNRVSKSAFGTSAEENKRTSESSDEGAANQPPKEEKNRKLAKRCLKRTRNMSDLTTPHVGEHDLGARKEQGKQFVLVVTSTNAALDEAIKSFASLFNTMVENAERCRVTVVPNFESDLQVTHVVSGAVDKRMILRQRTMKCMQAMACGAWVVSGNWVLESVKRNLILDEKPYEVVALKAGTSIGDHNAPQRARQARLRASAVDSTGTSHLLFSGHSVLFLNDFPGPGAQKSQLAFLVTKAGGTVVDSLSDLNKERSDHKFIVVTSSEELGRVKDEWSMNGYHNPASLVDSYWVMNSITNYRIEAPSESMLRKKNGKIVS